MEIPSQRFLAEREEFASGFLGRTMDLHFTITRAIDLPPQFPPSPISISPLPLFPSPHPSLLPWVHRVAIRFVLLGFGFGTYSRFALLLCCSVIPAPCLGSCTGPPPLPSSVPRYLLSGIWFLLVSDSAWYCLIVSCSSRLYFKKLFSLDE